MIDQAVLKPDEKELYIMKTAHNDKVKFHILSMEKPDKA